MKAYLAGSFDPIHNGHLRLAQEAMKLYGFDSVVFLTGINPAKLNQTPIKDRLEMMKLACEEIPGLEVSERLFDPREPDNEVDAEANDGALPTRLMGSDVLLRTFSRRKDYEELLRRYNYMVRVREKDDVPKLQQLQAMEGTSIDYFFLDTPETSTDVRALVAGDQDTSHILPPKVREYIDAHNLYRDPENGPRLKKIKFGRAMNQPLSSGSRLDRVA